MVLWHICLPLPVKMGPEEQQMQSLCRQEWGAAPRHGLSRPSRPGDTTGSGHSAF